VVYAAGFSLDFQSDGGDVRDRRRGTWQPFRTLALLVCDAEMPACAEACAMLFRIYDIAIWTQAARKPAIVYHVGRRSSPEAYAAEGPRREGVVVETRATTHSGREGLCRDRLAQWKKDDSATARAYWSSTTGD